MGRKLIGVPCHETRIIVPEHGSTNDVGVGREKEIEEDPPGSEFEGDVTITTTEPAPDWVDKIKDAIPIEIVTAWIAIDALLLTGADGPDGVYWAAFAAVLVATALHMWVDIELPDAEQDAWTELPTWKKTFAVGAHIALTMGAFVVWALYLLSRVEASAGDPWYYFEQNTAVLLVLYTLIGPQLVPELVSKTLGVEVKTVEESAERPSA